MHPPSTAESWERIPVRDALHIPSHLVGLCVRGTSRMWVVGSNKVGHEAWWRCGVDGFSSLAMGHDRSGV
eukprot:5128950-Prymnesium_polylepis.1